MKIPESSVLKSRVDEYSTDKKTTAPAYTGTKQQQSAAANNFWYCIDVWHS